MITTCNLIPTRRTSSYFSFLFLFISVGIFAQVSPQEVKTYYPDGKVETISTMLLGKYHGSYKGYYPDGTLWSEGHYLNGELSDTFKVYTPEGNLADVLYFKAGERISKQVFWQDLPNEEFIFVSKKGFYTIRNGKNVKLDASTPDGIIEKTIDENNNEVIYIWKGGKRQLYEEGKPDGMLETIYKGDAPGVYEWKGGKQVFVRKLTKEDYEQKKKDDEEMNEILKKLNLPIDTTR